MSERLEGALEAMSDVEHSSIVVESADYQRFPAPQWARLSNPWEGQAVLRQKLRQRGIQELLDQADALVVQSWEFAVVMQTWARKKQSVAIMDATPLNMHQQISAQGNHGLKRRMAHWLHDRAFAGAVKNFSFLLPMGSDSQLALVEHYGIDVSRTTITLAPQNINFPAPDRGTLTAPLRLFFAGNDFDRKGGPFLLDLMAHELAGWCHLTIASNDPHWNGKPLPENVTWLRGKTQGDLWEIYAQSHVFVLPTKQDFMPQVLAEALVMGLPCLASNVGGIRDLVISGQTGYLLEGQRPRLAWVERLRHLSTEPGHLETLSRQARKFAEQHLDIQKFNQLLERVLRR